MNDKAKELTTEEMLACERGEQTVKDCLTVDLNPCPFCGSTDIDAEPNTDIYGSVCCNKCGFSSPYGEISIMIERWNTRPLEDALQTRIAELEAALDKAAHQKPEEGE